MKIILTDYSTLHYNGDLSLEVFKNFGEVQYFEAITKEQLLSPDLDANIILCNKTLIDRDVMQSFKSLKFIGLFATGYNNIDLDAANEFGITVCNAGSYSTSAVAQQVFAYILAHYSRVQEYSDYVNEGGWIKSSTFSMLCFPTDELKDKTIGIIGYGSIGRRVSEIATAFEMKVLVHTRTKRQIDGIDYVSFDELLSRSDIVTVHCPLNEQSRQMFNADAFKKCKDGAFFINTARGGVLDENALRAALENGKLSGAAVDVLENEPMRADCPLYKTPNLIITPHTAWAPLTTRQRLVDIVCSNITAFLNGNPQNKVN